MKKIVFLIAAAVVATASNCAAYSGITVKANNKNIVTRFVDQIGMIDVITVAGDLNVEYEQGRGGAGSQVQIVAADNVQEFIEVIYGQGMVSIGLKNGVKVSGGSKTKITVSSPSLRAILINGSGTLTLKGNAQFKSLDIKISGKGKVVCNKLDSNVLTVNNSGEGSLECKSLVSNATSINLTGKGGVEIRSGRTTKAELTTSGSGSIKASRLSAQDVSARVSGKGSIDCNADKNLVGNVTGSGKINYTGHPSTVSANGKKENIKQK